jgi:ribosomal protein S18 acetylase RimI-like enzyme
MNNFKFWNKVKPYLFSKNTILLLKREAETRVANVNSPAEIHQITTVQALADIMTVEGGQQLSVFENLLEKGDLCYYGYIDKRYVARGWVVKSGAKINYLRAWKTVLPSDSAYIYRLFTISSERGKHIAQKLISEVCNYLYEKDIYTLVLPTNVTSLKAFDRCGFNPVKSINIMYLFFIPIIRIKKLSLEKNLPL